MKKVIFALALLSAIGIFSYQQLLKPANSAPAAGAQVGQAPSPNKFSTLEGQEISLPPQDGKVSVLNLWATWCPPCREEMPELQAFYSKYQTDSQVGLYLIDHAESPAEIKEFFQAHNYTMPTVIDTKGVSGQMFATRSIPTTLVLDKKGVVVFRKVGPVTLAELESAVQKAKNS